MSTCVNDPIKTSISKTPFDNLRQMPRKSATMSFLSQNHRDLSEWQSSIDTDTDIKKFSIADMESEVFQTTDTDMRFTKIADADASRVSAKLWSIETFQMVGS